VSAALTTFVGIATAIGASIVLAGWTAGSTSAARLVTGWRVMVPSSAFGFLCAGLALAVASSVGVERRSGAWVVRVLALATVALPLLTLTEYALDTRWFIEQWLLRSVQSSPMDPYAGRMSAMTSICFVLLGLALFALAWPGAWGAGAVRFAAGTALAMSWLALLTVSFDSDRLSDTPRFPGMAAPTIVLFAVTSAGILSCSSQAIARLRAANADIGLAPRLLIGAFVLPMVLGWMQAWLATRLDGGLVIAIVTTTFAAVVTVVLWRSAARMQRLRGQREALRADLEARVTDRTKALADANDELQRSQERLREADRRKDEFLATLAHELRNPLAPIRTSVELLKADGVTPDVKDQAHHVITRQMQHMVRLIDDLLDVSRIAADKLTLKREAVDMRNVIAQAVETARSAIDRAHHELTIDVPDTQVVVQGDDTRLTQVVANLLLNACKYTPPRGRITLTAARRDGWVDVRVRDTGIGIPASFLPRLFEKFSQVTPALDAEGGLGLGLALVRAIVQLHGGSVDVHSDGPGQGSEFTLRLPLAGARGAAVTEVPVRGLETAPSSAGARPQAARRVLIADDNDDNANALAELLRHRGHVVETAGDGEAAYAAAEQHRPDVVMLDIGMPKLNGYEVCRRIREQPWGRQMRIVAQTGWGQSEDRRRSTEAGFDSHLVKPIDPGQLDRLLER
jgi:signal transduction histidine kinase/CheY-like chemotaxis protein